MISLLLLRGRMPGSVKCGEHARQEGTSLLDLPLGMKDQLNYYVDKIRCLSELKLPRAYKGLY